jgi:elongator complex protein 3
MPVFLTEMDFYSEIISVLKEKEHSKKELNSLKNALSKKHRLKRIPTDAQILLHASAEDFKKLKLVTKPTRTMSGVAPIALMTMPEKCPHGTCIYCPGGPGSVFGDVPQSYTGNEPSAMRSIRNHYDPYLIVFNRLEQYVVLNQNPEKTEVIIQGGTFPAYHKEYKEEFVMYIFKAMNDFSEMFYAPEFDFAKFRAFFELPGDITDKNRTRRIQEKLLGFKGNSTLEKEQGRNETAKIRCVGLTIETKPDWGLLEHANEMLEFGCTRVELGIQATDEKIIKFVNRGHTIQDSIESTRILKDLGFKINYHMMPGLPLSSPEKDLEMLKETLDNPDYRPDMFKIYPTMVIKGTALYNLYKLGKYKPLTREHAADIISELKRDMPYWIRIMRVQRDIPTYITEAGVDKTNLRQYIEKKLDEKGIKCRCIRCREAGLVSLKKKIKVEPKLFVVEYEASNGREFFISFENPSREILFGYCRLRFPSQSFRKEITDKSAIIRELHVVGTATGIGEEGNMQHKGLGRKLLEKAQEIAKEHGKDRMVVISGVGVREYYRKLGYAKDGPYMVKN